MINTVRADFEVKNHQYALTKINPVLDWTGLILYNGHLNTFLFSCISVSKHHSHVHLWAASRGSIDPKLPPSETESQCKCGQNTSPASPHTNKSFSAVKRSTFSSDFLYLDQRNPTPKDIYWQFGFFRQHAQIERALVAVGKSDLGKSRVICWCCWSQWETPP